VIQRELDHWQRLALDRDDPVAGYAVITKLRLRRVKPLTTGECTP
jgi:hypothetical protein